MVNAFELGMAELAEEVSSAKMGEDAYKYTQDVNQYIINKSGANDVPLFCKDNNAVDLVKADLLSTLNFRSRKIISEVKKRN